jgi:hypothetical protein
VNVEKKKKKFTEAEVKVLVKKKICKKFEKVKVLK